MTHDHSFHKSISLALIQAMKVNAFHLAQRSHRLGLYKEAEYIQRIAAQLNCITQHKSGFDFIGEVAKGSTLLVGEGNLSFALSLAMNDRVVPSRLVATTFETVSNLSPAAKANSDSLRRLGVSVINGVNAKNLRAILGNWYFNTIIFQFPNTASRASVRGRTSNFVLVRSFLMNAYSQLVQGGKILITAVDSPYYRGTFQFDEAAASAGFHPPEVYKFDSSEFPGYEHTMTHETGSALENHDQFSTWVFRKD